MNDDEISKLSKRFEKASMEDEDEKDDISELVSSFTSSRVEQKPNRCINNLDSRNPGIYVLMKNNIEKAFCYTREELQNISKNIGTLTHTDVKLQKKRNIEAIFLPIANCFVYSSDVKNLLNSGFYSATLIRIDNPQSTFSLPNDRFDTKIFCKISIDYNLL